MEKDDLEIIEWNLSRIRQLKSKPNYEKLPEYTELMEEIKELRYE